MKGILHEILGKIEAVWNNWHAHADPAAQVKKAQQEFMATAADLIHELEAKVSELGGDATGELVKFVEEAKQKLEDLENQARSFVTTTMLEPMQEELVSLKADHEAVAANHAALEETVKEQGNLLAQALSDVAALKPSVPPVTDTVTP